MDDYAFEEYNDSYVRWLEEQFEKKWKEHYLTPIITMEQIGGKWSACFKIGNQKFRLAPGESKSDAQFACAMLENAFSKNSPE